MPADDKPTARTISAAAKTTKGLSPTDWGDSCFLCGHTIGEGVGIGFYQGKNSNARCHRSCLNQMEMVGGTPQAFHEWHAKRAQEPVHDKPVHQDVETYKAEVVSGQDWRGPRSIQFDSFVDLQSFIVARGAIPEQVRVAVGSYVMQSGG